MRSPQGGFSLLEATIALVILGLLLVAVLPYLTPKPMNLRADTNDLVANLRLARDLAISRTTHYRVRVVDETSYRLDRGTWNGTSFDFTPERVMTLRQNVRFGTTDAVVEFDSRGRSVEEDGTPVTDPVQFQLKDEVRGEQRTVWVGSTGGIWEE